MNPAQDHLDKAVALALLGAEQQSWSAWEHILKLAHTLSPHALVR